MSGRSYPFTSRRDVLARVDERLVEYFAILQDRYERRATAPGEPMGWMASHVAKATKLAVKLASGEATEKERADATAIAKRYGKQLARVFRERELLQRPDLLGQAALFGVDPYGRPDPWDDPRLPDPYAEDEHERDADAEPEPSPTAAPPTVGQDPPVVRRRPGRPKGSKTKIRKEAAVTPTKRRRRP